MSSFSNRAMGTRRTNITLDKHNKKYHQQASWLIWFTFKRPLIVVLDICSFLTNLPLDLRWIVRAAQADPIDLAFRAHPKTEFARDSRHQSCSSQILVGLISRFNIKVAVTKRQHVARIPFLLYFTFGPEGPGIPGGPCNPRMPRWPWSP